MSKQSSYLYLLVIFYISLTRAEHSVYQCPSPTDSDVILCQTEIIEGGKLLQTLTETLICPESGLNFKPITCIIVTNKLGEDGGNAEIVSGGVGYTNVQISMTSQRSKGLDYHIEIYRSGIE